MTDHYLDRIAFNPRLDMSLGADHHPVRLQPIPWPADVAPSPLTYGPSADISPLEKVDAVIVTWTAAEWQALCDVLAVNAFESRYIPADFDSFLPDLTDKSPAKDAGCLARVRYVNVGMKTVMLVHSMLHLATDGPTMPLKRLIEAIIEETSCERLITTGTAGGVGADKQLGDVVVGSACRFNCQGKFAREPFAETSYPTTLPAVPVPPQFADLINANAHQLPRPAFGSAYAGTYGEIETTDFFAFDTSTDHFGLRARDDSAAAVEMDDAVFGLVIADRMRAGLPCPHWGAVRNVSDPQADISKYATFEDAAADMGRIYRRYGYWTTVPSAIVSWLMAVA